MNFVDMLFFMARSNPWKNAIILPDRMITFGMLGAAIRSVAERLDSLIADKNKVVAVDIDSQTRHLITVSALHHLGIVSVSITGPMDPTRAGVDVGTLVSDRRTDRPGSFARLLFDDAWLRPAQPQRTPRSTGFTSDDQLARIIMSSGTTAEPKAIGMSARVVEDRILTGRRTLAMAPWDRMMCLPPLTSSLGFGTALQGLAYGHTVVIAESAADALSMIAAYNVDLLVANPQQLKEMVDAHKENPIPVTSLNLIKYGGSQLAADVAAEVRARFCKDIMCVYSSTETGPIAYGHIDLLKRPRTTGLVAPWVTAEVVNGAGEALPAGVQGRLRVRSQWQGYDMASGPAAARDWMYTGDLAVIHDDGLLELSGRAADAVTIGGQLVSPEQIEQALSGHPGILDCAALGMPSSIAADDEIWLAVVVSDAFDPDQARAFLLKKNPMWRIARIHRTGMIARNKMGKIVRSKIREELAQKA